MRINQHGCGAGDSLCARLNYARSCRGSKRGFNIQKGSVKRFNLSHALIILRSRAAPIAASLPIASAHIGVIPNRPYTDTFSRMRAYIYAPAFLSYFSLALMLGCTPQSCDYTSPLGRPLDCRIAKKKKGGIRSAKYNVAMGGCQLVPLGFLLLPVF